MARIGEAAAQAEAAGRGWLSQAERARLDAIAAPARRAAFLAGRWRLRALLAQAHGGDPPADWALTAPDDGPPALVRNAPALHLSISHSGDRVAVAFGPAPLGVDIEVPQPRRDTARLAQAVCTDDEQSELQVLPPAEAEARFYVAWTLKEAWLKQRGEGVAPGRLARIGTRRAAPGQGNARVWTDDGLVLALALPAGALVQCDFGAAALDAPISWWSVRELVG